MTRDGGLPPSKRRQRTPYDVIDQTIRENRFPEYLLYAFSSLFVALGSAGFVYSLWRGDWTVTVASSLTSGMFVPAMYYVRDIRRENQQIRLLEIPLNNSTTADDAARSLHATFRPFQPASESGSVKVTDAAT